MSAVNATRRTLVAASFGAAVLGITGLARAQRLPQVTVYKGPACDCCGEWVKHMRANGFKVETHEVGDLSRYRQKYGVPEALASCHTASVGGYAIEGHVPAADIKRLLKERPKAAGLAVPGMPQDAPGMNLGRGEPYDVLLFNTDGRYKVYQHYGPKRP